MVRLGLTFFNQPVETLARNLLGTQLTCHSPAGTFSGLIVETEAYLHTGDPAAHNNRVTHATRALRMGPGTLYIHPMRAYVGMDIVAATGSVLIRALQPLPPLPDLTTLCNGPGKLCRALHITREHYGLNLTDPTCPITLTHPSNTPPLTITITPRIGLTKNPEAPLRFIIQNSPYLSR